MGYEAIVNSKEVSLRDLRAGWYPQKTHGDIPGDLDQAGPVGASDCNNVFWNDGALRKMFGWNKVNATALNGGAPINGMFYSQVMADVYCVAGNKLYKGADLAIPTDITTALTISATAQVDWTEWQLLTDQYVIGTDGINPPFKYNGTTSTLLTNAPTCDFITTWQFAVWAARDEKVMFSNTGDPQIWDTDDNYTFDASCTGIGRLGNLFVFFMEDHIGILSGDNNRILDINSRYIDGVGCSGKQTIVNGKLNDQDVLFFHANDGFYAFDGSQNIIKISGPIDNKYQADDTNDRWNDTRFSRAWATFDYRFNFYFCGLSDGGQTANNTLLLLDCRNVLVDEFGRSTPHWPMKNVQAVNCIEFSRNQKKIGDLLFGSTNGFIYKFDQALSTRTGAAYTAMFKSKIFDMVNSAIVAEFNVLSKTQGTNSYVTAYINTSLEEGDGLSARANFYDNSDILDTTFILGSSELSGRSFILRNVGTSNFGRYFQFKLENNQGGIPMIIHSVDLILQQLGVETNVGN